MVIEIRVLKNVDDIVFYLKIYVMVVEGLDLVIIIIFGLMFVSDKMKLNGIEVNVEKNNVIVIDIVNWNKK